MFRSTIVLKCYIGDESFIEELCTFGLTEQDVTDNITSLIYEIRNQNGYHRIKYLRKISNE